MRRKKENIKKRERKTTTGGSGYAHRLEERRKGRSIITSVAFIEVTNNGIGGGKTTATPLIGSYRGSRRTLGQIVLQKRTTRSMPSSLRNVRDQKHSANEGDVSSREKAKNPGRRSLSPQDNVGTSL